MDELDERIQILRNAGIVDDAGKRDLEHVVQLLTARYGFDRSSEVLAVLVTHIAAAINRLDMDEEIESIPACVVEDISKADSYPTVRRVTDELLGTLSVRLPEAEADYVLVHVGGLVQEDQTRDGEVRA